MIRDLLDKIATLFTTNSSITNYCQTKYAKKQSVFVGIDTEDAPISTYYPLIAILSIVRQERGHSAPQESFDVVISVVIQSTSKDETTPGGVNLVKYSGFIEIEELREIIENAILEEKWGGSWVTKVHGQGAVGSFSNFFETFINVNFSRSNYRRLGHGVREE